MNLLLLSLLAAEPPERPKQHEPVDGQCQHAIGLEPGHQAPESLVEDGEVICGGVLVPTSDMANLILDSTYAEHLEDRYKIDTTSLEVEVETLQNDIETLSAPKPFFERPEVQRWTGRLEGALIGTAIAILVIEVSQD